MHIPNPPLRRTVGEKTQVYDPIRSRYVVETPEEQVRQAVIIFLVHELGYPAGCMQVEVELSAGASHRRRIDLAVMTPAGETWLLIECKRPGTPLSADTLAQVWRYALHRSPHYVAVTNGKQLAVFPFATSAPPTAGDAPPSTHLDTFPPYPKVS